MQSADREKVMSNGAWMVLYHYLAVAQWTRGFGPLSDESKAHKVWVEFGVLYNERAVGDN